jgi:hypothetical protein
MAFRTNIYILLLATKEERNLISAAVNVHKAQKWLLQSITNDLCNHPTLRDRGSRLLATAAPWRARMVSMREAPGKVSTSARVSPCYGLMSVL